MDEEQGVAHAVESPQNTEDALGFMGHSVTQSGVYFHLQSVKFASVGPVDRETAVRMHEWNCLHAVLVIEVFTDNWAHWCTPLIPILGWQRQVDL